MDSVGMKGVPFWRHEDMMAENRPQITGADLDTGKSVDESPC